jgi:hypothetical protein
MAALLGGKRYRPQLRFVAFDLPFLVGVDLRLLSWTERRNRLELLARAFQPPYELSPLVDASRALAAEMADGRLEGIVLKDRTSTYSDGSRRGWSKVKDPSWYEREAWHSIGDNPVERQGGRMMRSMAMSAAATSLLILAACSGGSSQNTPSPTASAGLTRTLQPTGRRGWSR